VIEGILGVEDRLKRRGPGSLTSLWKGRDEIPFSDPIISDSKLEMTGLLREERDGLPDLRGVVLIKPLFEKTVRNLQLHLFSVDGDEVNRFNPNVKILLTNPLSQGIDHIRPCIFHGKNLRSLGVQNEGNLWNGQNLSEKEKAFVFNGLRISFHNVSTIVDKRN